MIYDGRNMTNSLKSYQVLVGYGGKKLDWYRNMLFLYLNNSLFFER